MVLRRLLNGNWNVWMIDIASRGRRESRSETLPLALTGPNQFHRDSIRESFDNHHEES